MTDDSWKRFTGLLAAVLVAVGCGGGEEGGAAGGGEPEAAAEAAAPIVDPATAATVRGTVSFEGTPPAAQPIDMAEEPSCVEAYGPEGPRTQEVVVNDGRLANVFVYVKEGLSQEFPAPSEAATLDQVACRYHPHVLGVQVGQPLAILNSDDLLHNINAKPAVNRGFNISQPRAGMESTREFRAPEVMIPVQCDVHGWMQAYVGVLPHPYFAVAGADGTFEIPNLPPGEYVIEAWHETYGTQTQNVSVGASETAEVSFTYSADMARGAVVPLGEPLIVRHEEAGAHLAGGSRSDAGVTP
ncbi:MAG: carboxypeptidase regulatory-like domain-containing protein [Gemmatimonadota bacterium]